MFTPMTSPELMLKLHTVREREALTKAASEQLVAHVHSRKLHGGYGFFVGAGANLISAARRLTETRVVRNQAPAV